MPPRNDAILWIDLETSGSSDDQAIVEIGAVLTDATPHFKELSRFSVLVDYQGMWENEIVANMHDKSGLSADLNDGFGVQNIKVAEAMMIDWIESVIGKSTTHIPWGGAGVGHFDSKFIRRDMPKLSKKITWWVYDTNVLRRFNKLIFDMDAPRPRDKTHRALDDVLDDLEWLRTLDNYNLVNIYDFDESYD